MIHGSTSVRLSTYSVGQGLFHGGRFCNAASDFRFVYDCGAVPRDQSYLRREVEAYKRYGLSHGGKQNLAPLDLLAISHLHFDHVAGIPELLDGMRVDLALLPYLTPIERLFLAASQRDAESWYLLAVGDPVSYLISRGVRRVLLLGPGDREAIHWPPWNIGRDVARRDDQADLPNGEPPELRIQEESLQFPDDPVTAGQVQLQDPQLIDALNSRKLLVKSHQGLLDLGGWWGFKFFTLPIEEELLDIIRLVVGRILDRDITKEQPLTQPQLHSLLSSEDVMDRLREIGEAVAKESKLLRRSINNTSLMAFHSPLRGSVSRVRVKAMGRAETRFGFDHTRRFENIQYFEGTIRGSHFGHFLFGDVSLVDPQLLAKAIDHYTDTGLECISFQLPHHGSKENWSDQMLSLIGDATYSVVSAGVGSEYGHPAPSVLERLMDARVLVFWSNQFSRIEESALFVVD